jgi:membrane-associated phospholipid phosphatase
MAYILPANKPFHAPVPYWKRLAAGMLAVSSALFVLIASNIAAGDPLAIADARAAVWLNAHATPALTLLVLGVTHAHSPLPLCAYSIFMMAKLARRREWHWTAGVLLAVPVGLLINVLLKVAFRRARPVLDHPIITLATYSFPSGHTAGATLFYGVLFAYIGSRSRDTRVRAACIAAWLLLVTLVAFSRMYLGVHYLSDVLAAVAWSLAWLALCVISLHTLYMRGKRIG